MNSSTQDTDSRRSAPWIVPAAVLLSIGGIGGLLLTTRWGIGVSPDSVQYIKAARQLLGEPSGGAAASLVQHAPLYSFLLAAGGVVGLDPLDGARWLNAAIFGLNIFLVGFMVRRSSHNTNWPWVVAAILTVWSMPVLGVHASALTEPVFLLLALVGFHCLTLYLEGAADTGPRWLLAAALSVGLAFLARYAGAALILTVVAAVLLWGPGTPGRRFRHAVLFGAVASLPMLTWMLRNMAVASSATGREFAFHPVGTAHAWQTLYTVSSWLFIPAAAPDVLRLMVWAAVGLGAVVLLARRASGPGSLPAVVRVLILFMMMYAAFLAASISFFDANTLLDDRTLVPVYIAGAMVLLLLLDGAWPIVRSRTALGYLVAAMVAVFTAGHVVNGTRVMASTYESGWGFTSRAWRESPVLARARSLREGVPVYSNAPEIVYLHTGRPARSVPRTRFLMSQQPNRDFPAQMAQVRQELQADCGVVIYFRNLKQQSLPTERELQSQLDLQVLGDEPDGAVLGVVACPQ